MLPLPGPAPGRLFFIAVSVLLALALGGCTGMLIRDPVRINVVGIEPPAGEGGSVVVPSSKFNRTGSAPRADSRAYNPSRARGVRTAGAHDRDRLRGVWFLLIQPAGLSLEGHEPGHGLDRSAITRHLALEAHHGQGGRRSPGLTRGIPGAVAADERARGGCLGLPVEQYDRAHRRGIGGYRYRSVGARPRPCGEIPRAPRDDQGGDRADRVDLPFEDLPIQDQ
jgi:hypothetical protein